MASVLSLASIASCDSAPIASAVLAIGPTDRALDRRGSSPAAAETLAPGDVALGRCEPASASLSFHFVTSRAFLLADDPRCGAVPGVRPDLGTVVGMGSLTPAELDPFTPEARRLLVEDAAFGLWRGVPVPVEESLFIANLLLPQTISITWAKAINAGLSSPSISMLFSIVTNVRPAPFSSMEAIFTRLRTRLPERTGARNRTRSKP